MKTVTKEEFEQALSNVILELENASPYMTHALVKGIQQKRKCSVEQAIREFAGFQVTLQRLLMASQKSDGKSSS